MSLSNHLTNYFNAQSMSTKAQTRKKTLPMPDVSNKSPRNIESDMAGHYTVSGAEESPLTEELAARLRH